MRYFANDGSTTHGPASVEELIARPWFDGDVLVCPVGSQDSGDWKPALAYPAFKLALLAPPKPVPAIPALPPPPAALPAPTPSPAPVLAMAQCPHCGGENLARAHFCGDCGRRMDGTALPAPSTAAFEPPVYDLPARVELPPAYVAPAADEPPVYDLPPRDEPPHFAPLRPMERRPERSGPMAQPLSPDGDSQPEASFTPQPEHTFASLSSLMPHPLEPEPSTAAEPTPAADVAEEPAPLWKRPAVVAIFLGAAAFSGAAAWLLLKPVPVEPPVSGADLNLSAPQSSPAGGGEPSSLPQSPAPIAEVPRPALAAKTRPVKSLTTGRPKRKRAPRAAAQPDISDAILIESRAPDNEPTVPGAQGEAGRPLSDPDSVAADFLPGIPRRPGLKAAKPKSAKRTVKPAEDPDTSALDAALAAPFETASTGGSAAKAAAAAANPADALALQQAVEEFEFCTQLLSQGAYADHFDTCLCKETREKAPYRNRRGLYVTSLEKEASAGRLEVRADIISTRMENGAARIVAKWKARGNDPGREVDETWIMDDGLWCKAP